MNGKAIVVGVILAVMSTAGVAGSADNSTSTSYFEGVWSGTWDMGPTGQDVTITIGEKNQKGAHKITYAYGWGKSGAMGTIPPGSFVAYGREQDGVFTFWWKNKDGTKTNVTMNKFEENVVKARYEREGPKTAVQKPYYDANLKRK